MNIINSSFAEELALELLKIDAVVLRPNEPFVWASGWNSPIYCDNRLTLTYPELRKKIANSIASHIIETHPEVDVITGTATAGIPHTAWVSDILDKPMAYVRSKAKSYGMGNQIEGGVKKGQSTVIIEDLVSTGGSVMSVVDVLEFVGANVDEVISIFTYGFDVSNNAFKERELPFYTLTNFDILINVAQKHGFVDADEVQLLNSWRKDPDTWPKK